MRLRQQVVVHWLRLLPHGIQARICSITRKWRAFSRNLTRRPVDPEVYPRNLLSLMALSATAHANMMDLFSTRFLDPVVLAGSATRLSMHNFQSKSNKTWAEPTYSAQDTLIFSPCQYCVPQKQLKALSESLC